MKKLIYFFAVLFICLITSPVQAAVSIYVKITDATGTVITQGVSATVTDGQGSPIDLKDYMAVTSVQYDQQQTLNISNQGTGAGKLIFSPLVMTKTVDAVSAKLMQYQAAVTRLSKIEILFVKSAGGSSIGNVFQKMVLATAFVNTYSIKSIEDCGNGCPPVAESISFEYGAMQMFTYTLNANRYLPDTNPFGWNRVTNAEEH